MTNEDEKCTDKQTELQNESVKTSYGLGVRHVQMACMCLAMCTLFVGRGCMSVAVLAMTDRAKLNSTDVTIYDWDKKTQGFILSSFFWGNMVMQVPGGILSNRFGGKPVILMSLLIDGVMSLSIPTLSEVGGWRLVCIARLVMGLSQGCLFPGSHTLLGRWLPPRERTQFTGIVYSGYQLGSIISMPISGMLASTAMGWKLIYYVVSALTFATAGVWYAFAASTPAQHRLISDRELKYIQTSVNVSRAKAKLTTPWRCIFRSPAFWAIVCSQFSMQAAFNFIFVDMPTYLEKGLKMSVMKSASLSALPYAGMWGGGVAAAALSERLQNGRVLAVLTCRKIFNTLCLFGTAVGLTMLSFLTEEQQSLAVFALVLCLTMCGCSSAGYIVNFLDLSPTYAGVMLGISNTIATVGAIVIPIFTGFVLKNDPSNLRRWAIVFLTIAAVNIISTIVYLIFASSERQEWDDPKFVSETNAELEETQVPLKTKTKYPELIN